MFEFKKEQFVLLPLICLSCCVSFAEEKLTLIGKFSTGLQNVMITKVYDESANVYCYIYAPQIVGNKLTVDGYAYEANGVGSISCVNAQVKTSSAAKK